MNRIVEFHDEEFGTMYLEIEEKQGAWKDIANEQEESKKITGKLDNVLQSLKTFGKGVISSVESLAPHEVELKAGLKLELKEGILIGLLARAKSEFPFEVTLKWKFNQEDDKIHAKSLNK